MNQLVADMRQVKGVEDIHDLHVWCITNGMTALSCHIVINDQMTSTSCSILREIESTLQEKYNINHSTIQFEHEHHQVNHCTATGLYCQLEGKQIGQCHDHEHSEDQKALKSV